ncbi:hypothetical protein TSUD_111510 [Trifolium subterraneum]|uniref:Uncharacterized protein n=1 Tax=Trifolium subterraneum TaxID=3900 RepID=A0A2Z6M987_TRISU|nr:hypothetical protein TSUD_111510 [Trifolium subterraneum]
MVLFFRLPHALEKRKNFYGNGSLKSMLPSSSESQLIGCGIGFRLYIDKNCGTEEKEVDKVSVDPANEKITTNLRIVSIEQQRFLAAHSLKQWWPSDAELSARYS